VWLPEREPEVLSRAPWAIEGGLTSRVSPMTEQTEKIERGQLRGGGMPMLDGLAAWLRDQ